MRDDLLDERRDTFEEIGAQMLEFRTRHRQHKVFGLNERTKPVRRITIRLAG
jgi:hypothetical protein